MKKIFTKALSVFLATLMLFAVAPAAVATEEVSVPAAPVFSLEILSETAEDVVVAVVLKENTFKCLDLIISSNDNLILEEIDVNINLNISSSNVNNGMISVATLEAPAPDFEVAKYTYNKLAEAGVTSKDFSVTFTGCGVEYNGENFDVTESVVFETALPEIHEHKAGGDWFVTKPSSCSEKGTQVRYCEICKEIAETDEIALADHLNKTTDHKDATCTEAGYDKVICNDCGETLSEAETPALNHKDTKEEHKDATCSENGYNKVICNDCGEIIEETVIESKGHGETETKLELPGCETDGYNIKICTVCGETVSETVLPANGHSYITHTENATCTTDGLIAEICTACQHTKQSVTIPHSGHNWLDWKVIEAPSYSKNGVERRVCGNCGIDEERSVPKLVAKPTQLVLNQQEIGVNFRGTTRLFANVNPEEAAYSTEIIWESSDESVATVDETGAVYAVALGTATITARTADGSLSATCEVTVSYSIIQWIIVYILFGWIWYL